ncbi:hypothetical protein N9414_02436 [Nodularia spumigena CCY9414]|nr:hypothetical protein N9414_02436 [Nodularia spumigena CCY9414]
MGIDGDRNRRSGEATAQDLIVLKASASIAPNQH